MSHNQTFAPTLVKLVKLVGLVLLIRFLTAPSSVHAQPFAPLGNLGGIGPWAQNLSQPSSQLAAIISTIVGIMTIGASIWFIFQIITGAIAWIGSSGDKAQLQQAQKRITSAVIGLVIVVSALVIANLIFNVLGIEILNLDLSTIVP